MTCIFGRWQAPCVWTCGSNNWGQLGVLFGAEEDSTIPRPLLSLQSVKPCKVACGTNHSLVVTEGGDLYVALQRHTYCCYVIGLNNWTRQLIPEAG